MLGLLIIQSLNCIQASFILFIVQLVSQFVFQLIVHSVKFIDCSVRYLHMQSYSVRRIVGNQFDTPSPHPSPPPWKKQSSLNHPIVDLLKIIFWKRSCLSGTFIMQLPVPIMLDRFLSSSSFHMAINTSFLCVTSSVIKKEDNFDYMWLKFWHMGQKQKNDLIKKKSSVSFSSFFSFPYTSKKKERERERHTHTHTA